MGGGSGQKHSEASVTQSRAGAWGTEEAICTESLALQWMAASPGMLALWSQECGPQHTVSWGSLGGAGQVGVALLLQGGVGEEGTLCANPRGGRLHGGKSSALGARTRRSLKVLQGPCSASLSLS